jgi:hypothetical protein
MIYRLLFLCATLYIITACSDNEEALTTPEPACCSTGGGAKSKVTDWLVTEFVNRGTIEITDKNSASHNFYFQMSPNGNYLLDNFINECGGKFTTDNKSKIDFVDRIDCTQICCDQPEYTHLKSVLISDVAFFTVNADTSELVLKLDENNFIKLKRR